MIEDIRIFVAATPSEWLPMRVLEFSILETSSLPVKLVPLYSFDRPIPLPKSKKNQPRTPFSFQRFLIPEMCGYEGKAIYLDSDMLVFKDICQIWKHPLNGCDLQTVEGGGDGRSEQFSVMLLNCRTLPWNINDIVDALNSGELDYEGLMYEMCLAKKIGRDLPAEWNALEKYKDGVTALLHYTDMQSQPWVSIQNPLGNHWISCLRRALAKGMILYDDLEREVAAGHIRPSLLLEIETSMNAPNELQDHFRILDKEFIAPFQKLGISRIQKWLRFRQNVKGMLRRINSFKFKREISNFQPK